MNTPGVDDVFLFSFLFRVLDFDFLRLRGMLTGTAAAGTAEPLSKVTVVTLLAQTSSQELQDGNAGMPTAAHTNITTKTFPPNIKHSFCSGRILRVKEILSNLWREEAK